MAATEILERQALLRKQHSELLALASTMNSNSSFSPTSENFHASSVLHQLPSNSMRRNSSLLSQPGMGVYGLGNGVLNSGSRMLPGAYGSMGMGPNIAGMGLSHPQLAAYGGMQFRGGSEDIVASKIQQIDGIMHSLNQINQMKQRLLSEAMMGSEQLQGMMKPEHLLQLGANNEPSMQIPSCAAAADMQAATSPSSEVDITSHRLLSQHQAMRSMLATDASTKRARGEDDSGEEEKGQRPKRRKKCAHQIMLLRGVFQVNRKPSKMCIGIIARQTHLTYQEVSRWFRNARHKSKKHTLSKQSELLEAKAETDLSSSSSSSKEVDARVGEIPALQTVDTSSLSPCSSLEPNAPKDDAHSSAQEEGELFSL